MKKNFTVNISGIMFHIDDDAYEKLEKYLESIKSHYRNSEGAEDILSDIEARIAEMLQEKLSEEKKVITLTDIEEVIKIMGQPYEFEAEPADEGPAPRSTRPRRLFRDTDNRILAGVCSGMGAYFNTDPLWFRLAFIALTFVGGTGLLIYIILWLAVPEAITTAEKLEMQGQEVTIATIEKKIREEFSHLEDKINDLTDKAREVVKKKSTIPSRNLKKAGNGIGKLLKKLGRFILGITGGLLILIGIMLTLAFLSIFLNFDNINMLNLSFSATEPSAFFRFLDVIFISHYEIILAILGAGFLIGIPLLMLIIAGIKMIFDIKSSFRIINTLAFVFWILGLILCGIITIHVVQDFDHRVTTKQEITVTPLTGEAIYFNLQAKEHYQDVVSHHDDHFMGELDRIFINENNEMIIDEPVINIIASEDDKIHASYLASARGRSLSLARKRANRILYDIYQSDSSFSFDPFYRLHPGDEWRQQRLTVQIEIPPGGKIIIHKNILRYIRDNEQRLSGRMGDRILIMTEKGLAIQESNNSTGYTSPTRYKINLIGMIRPI